MVYNNIYQIKNGGINWYLQYKEERKNDKRCLERKEELNMTKNLNYKNMVAEYMNARREMENVWSAFFLMKVMGFISDDTWTKFFNKCKSWHYESSESIVYDGYGNVVKEFD